MRITMQWGYNTYTADLSANELEVMVKAISKLERAEVNNYKEALAIILQDGVEKIDPQIRIVAHPIISQGVYEGHLKTRKEQALAEAFRAYALDLDSQKLIDEMYNHDALTYRQRKAAPEIAEMGNDHVTVTGVEDGNTFVVVLHSDGQVTKGE